MLDFTVTQLWSSTAALALGLLAWIVLNRRLWVTGPERSGDLPVPDIVPALFIWCATEFSKLVSIQMVDSFEDKNIVAAIVSIGTVLACLYLWKQLTGKLPFGDSLRWLAAGKGFIHIVTLFPLVILAGAINIKIIEDPSATHPVIEFLISTKADWTTFAGFTVMTVLIAPIVEEIMYRGLLQGSCQKLMGFVPALIFQCGFFMINHPTYSYLPMFAFAMCLTLVTSWSRSLIPAIVMHMVFNGVNMYMVAQQIYGAS